MRQPSIPAIAGILACLCLVLAGPIQRGYSGEPAPADIQALMGEHCLDCHDPSVAEGGVGWDVTSIQWDDEQARHSWELAIEMVDRRRMPPPDAGEMTDEDRTRLVGWLDRELRQHCPIGGGKARRLSRREYQNTVRDLFGLANFVLPASFPPDSETEGFDNQTTNLVLSPSHLEAFSQSAEAIADEFFGPSRGPVESTRVVIPAEEMVISYSSAFRVNDAMRLASRGSLQRNGTWPTKFEAPANGIYQFRVEASSYLNPDCSVTPEGHVPELVVEVIATAKRARTSTKIVETFPVLPGETQTFEFSTQLDRGQTIALRYGNSPVCYEDVKEWEALLGQLFAAEPKLASAWKQVGDPARGGSGWEQVLDAMANPPDAAISEDPVDDGFARAVAKKNVNTGETLVYKFFDQGPWLAVESLEIEGPTKQLPDRDDVRRSKQKRKWLAGLADSPDEDDWKAFYREFLGQAFRRPCTNQELNALFELYQQERQQVDTDDAAHHLVIRHVLLSPSFLFRGLGADESENGRLDDHDLATRLSYFLTSGMPDEELKREADEGALGRSDRLRGQALRLLRSDRAEHFIRDFTHQWLGLGPVDRLMPDQRLIRKFDAGLRKAFQEEPTKTLQYVLDENRSTKDLIAPDFLWTTPKVASTIYGLKNKKQQNQKKDSDTTDLQRYGIERFGRVGGLLAMAPTMMATANGVDTQPVLRGVWVLENILGTPPPEPPDAVPALTPDITGASTPKERLAAHMSDESCASCHREIDPLGFVLENFDPIGRWRDHYPTENKSKGKRSDPLAVDATGVLPDGTAIQDITDLKRWLDEHPERFARALSLKLMTYATGRELNYRERARVDEIVAKHAPTDFRMRDLLIDLIDSDVFRSK